MRKEEYEMHIEVGIGQKYKGKNYVIRWFTVYKVFGPEKKNEYKYYENARVFYFKDKVTCQKDYYYYDVWTGKRGWHYHNIGGLGNISIPGMHIYPETYMNMIGTCMEYSMAKEYAKKEYSHTAIKWNEYNWDIVNYLTVYKKNPILEMLIKCDCRNLTRYIVRGLHITTWRGKNPWEMLGIKKERLKALLKADNLKMWEWFKWEKETGNRLKPEEMEWIEKKHVEKRMLREIIKRMSLKKVINYITKQTHSGNCEKVWQMLDLYNDYIRMAERLDYDTYDEIVYKPKNIRIAHEKLVEESEKKDAEESAKEVYKEYKDIKQKLQKAKKRYEYSNEKYMLKMPDCIEDILIEGRTLHHCVSSSDRYFERIDTGETYIGFVRRIDEENIPFYSIEFEPGGNVRQKRTYYNRHDENYEEVIAFLLEWQQEVKKNMTKKEKQLAEISIKKRLEGMEEYKKKSPDFAEKMEADFLAADNEPPQIMLDIKEIQGKRIA